jgi:hypothetical protein
MPASSLGYVENVRPVRWFPKYGVTRVIFAAVAALASLTFDPSQAVGIEAAWWAVNKEGNHWDCRYRSVAECRPNVVAGNRGWCNQNPYFVAVPTKRRPSR